MFLPCHGNGLSLNLSSILAARNICLHCVWHYIFWSVEFYGACHCVHSMDHMTWARKCVDGNFTSWFVLWSINSDAAFWQLNGLFSWPWNHKWRMPNRNLVASVGLFLWSTLSQEKILADLPLWSALVIGAKTQRRRDGTWERNNPLNRWKKFWFSVYSIDWHPWCEQEEEWRQYGKSPQLWNFPTPVDSLFRGCDICNESSATLVTRFPCQATRIKMLLRYHWGCVAQLWKKCTLHNLFWASFSSEWWCCSFALLRLSFLLCNKAFCIQ